MPIIWIKNCEHELILRYGWIISGDSKRHQTEEGFIIKINWIRIVAKVEHRSLVRHNEIAQKINWKTHKVSSYLEVEPYEHDCIDVEDKITGNGKPQIS